MVDDLWTACPQSYIDAGQGASGRHTDGSFARLEPLAVASASCSLEVPSGAAVFSIDRVAGLLEVWFDRWRDTDLLAICSGSVCAHVYPS